MKKSLKKTLLYTVLIVTPIVYTYNVNQDLHKELNNLKTQNKKQQEIIKQFEHKQTSVKDELRELEIKIQESEDRLRQRFDQEIKGIEEQIERIKQAKQIKEKYKNNYVYSFEGVVTAYTAGYESTQKRKGHPLYGVTASGTKAKQGRTIAMDKRFPFGTLVKIEGFDNIFVVQDRGGKIKGNRVDVYFDSVEEAIKFGKQKRKIYVIKLGKGVDKAN
jgi:3D (Asp-Asp-Asp) domain-containing protein